MDKIDAVITYVNMDDPEWKNRYVKDVGSLIQDKTVNNESRFRDYGGLKACLRSIDLYAPGINRVFLVVQSDSQVPSYINKEKVKIILHEDFIPKEVLPTYSAFSIELFLHLIPGLSEKFLYFNDDMVLLRPVVPEEFFQGNMIVHSLKESKSISYLEDEYNMRDNVVCDSFSIPIKNAGSVAKKYANGDSNILVSDHGVYSFTKTINNECYEKAKSIIIDSCTKIRSTKSIICGLYLYYAYLTDRLINVAVRTKNVHFVEGRLYGVISNIFNKYGQCLCINDRNITDFNLAKKTIQEALFARFNKKSKYESS